MRITRANELDVYRSAYSTAMQIYHLTVKFPKDERYSLTDQIRRSSRSVCANITEAYYRRKYPKNFMVRLSDAIAEMAETKVWLKFSLDCKYLSDNEYTDLASSCDRIIGKLIVMVNHPENWKI
jgi:four helix bundle protein